MAGEYIVVTNANNLPCKKIIHAVGPCLAPKPTKSMVSLAKKELRRAVWGICKIVESHSFQSVAIPALSSGIFNFPLRPCSETIVSTLKDFLAQRQSPLTSLTVNLVNSDEPTVRAMERACSKIFDPDGTFT